MRETKHPLIRLAAAAALVLPLVLSVGASARLEPPAGDPPAPPTEPAEPPAPTPAPEEKPADEKPMDDKPADDKPADDKPADKAGDKPAEQQGDDAKADPRFAGKTVAQLAEEGYGGGDSLWLDQRPLLGRPVPRLVLQNWVNGQAPQGRRVVVIEFVSPYSANSLPTYVNENNKLVERYRGKGVGFFAAAVQPDDVDLAQLARAAGAKYPVVRTDTSTKEAWKIGFYPTYAVMDRRGIVRAVGVRRDYVEPIIDAIIADEDSRAAPPKPTPKPPATRPATVRPPSPKPPATRPATSRPAR